MLNVNKLKGKIVEKGYTVSKLAEQIGIDKSTLYRKIGSTKAELTIGEAQHIAQILELNAQEVNAIFFDKEVA